MCTAQFTICLEADTGPLDNYSILLSHFTRQFNANVEEVRSFLGVTEDYEDI